MNRKAIEICRKKIG